MIALLCPSRMRPQLCQRMVQSVYDTTKSQIRIYIGVSEGFEAYKEALKLPITDRVGLVLVTLADYPTAHKWNKLCELATKQDDKLFMLAADDVIFETPRWDEALIKHYENLEDKKHVYHLQDSRDENGTPHPIVTREWVEKLGFFVPPIFLHWNVDSWTVGMAKDNQAFTHLKDFLLKHDKPSDTGQGDETHNRIRQMGWHERDMSIAMYSHDIYQTYLMRLRAV